MTEGYAKVLSEFSANKDINFPPVDRLFTLSPLNFICGSKMLYTLFLAFFFFFFLLRAAPEAFGGSQARG